MPHIGINGDYNYDNSLAGSDQLIYIPQYTVTTRELISEFVVMRLFPGGVSRLIVEYHPSGGGPTLTIFDKRLIELIPPGTDLDKEADFDIVLDFNMTTGNVTVTVNGWTTVVSTEILG